MWFDLIYRQMFQRDVQNMWESSFWDTWTRGCSGQLLLILTVWTQSKVDQCFQDEKLHKCKDFRWYMMMTRNWSHTGSWYLSRVVSHREIFEELSEDKCREQKSEACVFQSTSSVTTKICVSRHFLCCTASCQPIRVFLNTCVHSCACRQCPHSTSAALGGACYALCAPLTLKSATSVE